jgi:hypothetical protein
MTDDDLMAIPYMTLWVRSVKYLQQTSNLGVVVIVIIW